MRRTLSRFPPSAKNAVARGKPMSKISRMSDQMPIVPPRVPPVEPDLLASAIFLFGEYLQRLDEKTELEDKTDDDEDDEIAGDEIKEQEIETSAVLDLFTEELGTGVTETITLYMRVTALYRLLAASPSLAQVALDDPDAGGALTEDALVAAARLELHVAREGEDGSADFDAREFREALYSG